MIGCSREEYLSYLRKYISFYDSSIAESRFHPDMADKAIQVVASKRRRRHAAKS
jgi:hypothetical protein